MRRTGGEQDRGIEDARLFTIQAILTTRDASSPHGIENKTSGEGDIDRKGERAERKTAVDDYCCCLRKSLIMKDLVRVTSDQAVLACGMSMRMESMSGPPVCCSG